MALNSGTKLGPYEIQSPLGAGGMGEVYRARDTRLDRTVAIKILPSHLSTDADAKQRFEREARAISSLSHPNICHLYDVGNQDGTDYLVMEFLEGETLADRLNRGPLPLEQVLKIGTEICDGLGKAHRSGVVHRDLKPGNIMLTKSGAKLMDFGLAKAVAPVLPQSSGMTATFTSPAAGHPLTAQGTVMGTFQYMSPEQIEGKEADARSDIFSFGCVLYEMITGKRAFSGKSQISVMSAILEKEPEPITATQPLTPPALEHAVKTCLAKDPDDRFQTAHDVKLQLKFISQSNSAIQPASGAARPLSRQHKGERIFFFAACLLLAGLVTFFALQYANHSTQKMQANKVRFSFAPPKGTLGLRPALSFSPDGSILAFVATNNAGVDEIWLRYLDNPEPQLLNGTEGALFQFWAPDGKHLGFYTRNKLKTISIDGSSIQTLCDVYDPRGGSWGADDVIVFPAHWQGGLSRIAASGGEIKPLTTLSQGQTSHRWPTFLPDGKHFFFYVKGTPATKGLYLGSVDSASSTRLGDSDSFAHYSEPGFAVYSPGLSLAAQAFDVKSMRLKGEQTTLAKSVYFPPDIEGLYAFTASASGNLAYKEIRGLGTTLVWMDRAGKSLGTVGNPSPYQEPAISHDGRQLAVVRGDDIIVINLVSGVTSRLTFGSSYAPTWSTDDKRITYSSNKGGGSDIYEQVVGESGEAKLIYHSEATKNTMDWSLDGRYILFDNQDLKSSTQNYDTYALARDAAQPMPVLNTQFDESEGHFSPDGKWIAYTSNETGATEVYVRAFPSGAGKTAISVAGGYEPSWNRNGKEIFYVTPDRKLMSVPLTPNGAGIQAHAPVVLFQMNIDSLGDTRNHYAPAPDGKRFLVMTQSEENRNSPVNVIVNFTQGLKTP